MRTSAKYLTGLLALGLSMGGAAASAVEPSGVSAFSRSTAWFLQAEPGQPAQLSESAREKAMMWLQMAEKEMKAGRWENASIAIGNAEKFEQQMGAQETPLAYRPADARRKLGAMRDQAAGGGQLQLPPTNANASMAEKKQQASRLVAQAQAALDRDDLRTAQQLTAQACSLRVPDDQFLPNETLPWQLDIKVRSALDSTGVSQANLTQTGGQSTQAIQRSVYRPQDGPNQIRQVSGNDDASRFASGSRSTVDTAAMPVNELMAAAQRAMQAQDTIAARSYYSQLLRMQDQLDPQTRQFVQEKVQELGRPNTLPRQDRQSGIEEIDAQQQVILQRISQDIFREREVAERMRVNRDPRGALEHLQQLRERIANAEIDQASRQHYLNIVDREIREMEQYIERNLTQIQNDETNDARLQDVRDRNNGRYEMEQELAKLIESFNKLMDEGRLAEAEVVARQAYELAPGYPEVEVVLWKARFATRYQQMNDIREMKEENVWGALRDVEMASIPHSGDGQPMLFGDVKTWEEMTERRRRQMGAEGARSVEDLRLLQQVKTTRVSATFRQTPLAEVLQALATQANVNIDMNSRAMADEGVLSDTPITLDLRNDVTLESALNLILGKVGLTFEVRNEVVQVTTEELKRSNIYPDTYYVGDLVMPIPNFVPDHSMGLPSAIANSYRTAGLARGLTHPGIGGAMPGMFAGNGEIQNSSIAGMAQQLPGFPLNGGQTGPGMPPNSTGLGPGGMGGGVAADFDALIELITNTIAVESWDEVGGAGHIEEFRSNLSLVISQTQEVHEQIQDLLDQLRRLQDLQITIEVRFITLQDDFFERIGVDFDFDIRHGQQVPTDAAGNFDLPTAGPPTLTVGRQPVSNLFAPTADLDLQFAQDSFASAVPQFGGFDANTAANFGFAILSDIEVFMLLQASKGDTRTNILQAPKVTMFNGQTASVNDTSQRPFVTSVIPVVGDFAAAQMPVITVLNEGTQLSVTAVTSSDRRFVRMTLVPFFSQIGDVEEFTFEGTETTTTGSAVVDPTNPDNTLQDDATVTRTGTTVQLPVFGFTSVSTTVSVPDGGTVLLGGIKRLQEGRNERGVPVLSNVPYVSRLFKNVSIGRTTQSLMMMVTPRIIIQEEEEAAQVGSSGN